MIIEHEERISSDFQGTILDIETIGEFSKSSDSRRCQDVRQVILGCLNQEYLHIYCATDLKSIDQLKQMTPEILAALKRPFYAFNCQFESAVWFHHVGIKVLFDGELQGQRFERKGDVVRALRIPNYDDPFYDDGFKCLQAWTRKDFERAIAHNRACLLKERDILLKRKCGEPVCLEFVKARPVTPSNLQPPTSNLYPRRGGSRTCRPRF